MNTITRTVEKVRPNGDFLIIKAELRLDHPTLSPGFSITGDLWERHGKRSGKRRYELGQEQDAGGCLHDDVLRAAPGLAPLVAVHLADPDGIPMHAVANGWYFYSGKAREWEESHSNTYANREGLSDRVRGAQALHILSADLPHWDEPRGIRGVHRDTAPTLGRTSQGCTRTVGVTMKVYVMEVSINHGGGDYAGYTSVHHTYEGAWAKLEQKVDDFDVRAEFELSESGKVSDEHCTAADYEALSYGISCLTVEP